jgi:CHASE3 domain sensor protein
VTAYSDATLLGWLASKPEKLEKHLDKHPEDIDRLERLTALADHQVAAMEHTVSAPDDIAERVISRMKLDPQLKEAGSVFADMMTIGFRTLRVVFGSADDDDAAPDEDTPRGTTGGPDR